MRAVNPTGSEDKRQRAQLHSRIRRAKQILRPLPRRATLHRYPFIKWFAQTARRKPFLWSFRIPQISPALYIGCVLAFLPAYGVQLPLAFLAALMFRTNLLVIVALQFITNPLTIVPVYWFTLTVGRRLVEWWHLGEFDSMIGAKAYPLVIGGIFVGLCVAVILDLCYRFAASRRSRRRLDVKRLLES